MSVEYHEPKGSAEDVASPCVRNCCLNEQDICLGCFRHIDEIMAWRKLDTSAKNAVLSQCLQRQKQLK
ncbi:DUF1289 domain-containing protein [Colwellia sp. Arc7-635]|jgi:predicted Fe-S protein YdhL (DUF1289 family)|uniref:DUF1289 domain-containing protein n=1 Tax=Colwellia sp. Arc7-635 TaxID=2497879 RepID=UPI000F8509F4|nr:DUF1289 domain-containing protein [Colwellia sp. Arc7-635]AZQ82906.1 DUF1289 domain-containing protein [Colwellia sp. Arc7-635]